MQSMTPAAVLALVSGLVTAGLSQAPLRYQAVEGGLGGAFESFAVAGDFDGDGITDLLGGDLELARGLGEGEFAEPIPFGTPSNGEAVQRALVADFNRDGRDDLVLVLSSFLFSYVEYFHSTTQGLQRQVLPSGGGLGGCGGSLIIPVTSDVNSDGWPDLMFAGTHCIGSSSLPAPPLLLLGGPTGLQAASLPSVALAPVGAWIADMDGDMDLDLVFLQVEGLAGTQPSGRIVVLRQDPGMQFVANVALASSPVHPQIFANGLGDLTGDGLPDILSLNSGSTGEVLVNAGNGVLVQGPSTPPVRRISQLRVTDVDGDGTAEVLVRQEISAFEVWELVAGSVQVVAEYGVRLAGAARQFRHGPWFVGDVDDDGDIDTVLSRALWFGDQTRAFEPVVSAPDVGLPFGEFVDFDGDGLVDQIALGDTGLALAINDGAGRMVPDPTARFPDLGEVGFAHVRPVDFDRDGDTDLMLFRTAQAGGVNQILLNDGNRRFSVGVALPGHSDVKRSFAVDLDRDGDEDIVLIQPTSNGFEIEMLRNDGPNSFGRTLLYTQPALSDAIPYDVDQDGDLDLVVTGISQTPSGGSRLLLNDGVGNFAIAQGFPVVFAWSVAAGDLDADGDTDYVFDGTVVWNQAGSYTTAPLTQGTAVFVWGITNPDKQGRADVVVSEGANLSVYRFASAGGFLRIEQGVRRIAWPQFPARSLLVDVDGDGDKDVVAARGIYQDVSFQLTRQGLPRIGRTTTEVVLGPPQSVVLLSAAFGRVSLARPPFGTLYLDPASLVVVSARLMPNSGRLEVAVPIPNSVGLLDIEVFWQALFPNDRVFSNVEPWRIGRR